VLGAHGSDLLVGGERDTHQCRSVGFLVNDTVMVDAGTLSSSLSIEQQERIEYVLLSHLHHDHVKELPSLVDNLVEIIKRPIGVASISSVLKGLRTHLFNDQIFPNFFDLPTPNHPLLKEVNLEIEKETWISSIAVTAVPVNHLVPTVGYVIGDQDSAWIYSGDTYRTERIWSIASEVHNLKAVFIETSFPNEMGKMAELTGHLTPHLLAEEFKKIRKPNIPLYVYHLKPRFRDRIKNQLADLKLPNLTILEEGQEIEI